MKPVATYPRLTLSIRDAAAVSGIGKSTLWTYIRDGSLKSVKVGGKRLIHESALRELLQLGSDH